MELSKSDKKVARLLMDKGIGKELEICNNDIAEIIKEWTIKKQPSTKPIAKYTKPFKKTTNT
jgi:hypothetical protein